jgi:HNH endonuclease
MFTMQTIPLSQNQVAIVDDEDFERLRGFRWFFRGERDKKQGYAIRHRKDGKTYKTQYLHREIVGPIPPGHEVIFRNGDKLDCRKENLATVTTAEARQHHKNARSNSDSGIKGIHFNHLARTYSVDVYRDGRAQRVGTFDTLTDAQEALQKRLLLDNPDLHAAPARVDRTGRPAPGPRGGPDGTPAGGRAERAADRPAGGDRTTRVRFGADGVDDGVKAPAPAGATTSSSPPPNPVRAV